MRRLIFIPPVLFFIFASFISARSDHNIGSRSLFRPRSLSRTQDDFFTHIGRSRPAVRSLSAYRSRLLIKRFAANPVAYRCVLNEYRKSAITGSKDKACNYINKGKQTSGLSKWPEEYKPPDTDQFVIKSSHFHLWPFDPDKKDKIFDGSFFKKKSFNNFVVLDPNCQVAGVVKLQESTSGGRKVKSYANCEALLSDGTPIDPSSGGKNGKDTGGDNSQDSAVDGKGAGAGTGTGVGAGVGAGAGTGTGTGTGNGAAAGAGGALLGAGGAALLEGGTGVGQGAGGGGQQAGGQQLGGQQSGGQQLGGQQLGGQQLGGQQLAGQQLGGQGGGALQGSGGVGQVGGQQVGVQGGALQGAGGVGQVGGQGVGGVAAQGAGGVGQAGGQGVGGVAAQGAGGALQGAGIGVGSVTAPGRAGEGEAQAGVLNGDFS